MIVYVRIILKDVEIQISKFLQQHTPDNHLYKLIKNHAPPKIISDTTIIGHNNISYVLWANFNVLNNTLGVKNFDIFVAFLSEINHNKIDNILIRKDY